MRNVLRILLVVIAAFLIFVMTRPAKFHIERSTTIEAPADIVFDNINDFHIWPEWSAWEKLDPQLKRTYNDVPSGTGADYHWVGNDKVGEGRMTITESMPNERVNINLEFLKPFQAQNQVAFILAQDGPQTTVKWTMDGNNNFVGKAMSIFMDPEKMVGPDFEKGLASLKALSEAEAAKRATEAPPSTDPAAPAKSTPIPG